MNPVTGFTAKLNSVVPTPVNAPWIARLEVLIRTTSWSRG